MIVVVSTIVMSYQDYLHGNLLSIPAVVMMTMMALAMISVTLMRAVVAVAIVV